MFILKGKSIIFGMSCFSVKVIYCGIVFNLNALYCPKEESDGKDEAIDIPPNHYPDLVLNHLCATCPQRISEVI